MDVSKGELDPYSLQQFAKLMFRCASKILIRGIWSLFPENRRRYICRSKGNIKRGCLLHVGAECFRIGLSCMSMRRLFVL